MEKILMISLWFLIIGIMGCAQPQEYYKVKDGTIMNKESYETLKEESLNEHKETSEKVVMIEDLVEFYQNSDSIVYFYEWYFMDESDELLKEMIEKKIALVNAEYPMMGTETISGEVIDRDYLNGKPTLVNLWFTSCAPCIAEMPELNKMKEEYGDRFNFIAVTFDSRDKVENFLERHTFEFEHIVDSENLTSELGFVNFPANLFLDKDGVLRVIKGGLPFIQKENGKLESSDGSQFVEILKGLL